MGIILGDIAPLVLGEGVQIRLSYILKILMIFIKFLSDFDCIPNEITNKMSHVLYDLSLTVFQI